jgi:hypothetical protein
MSEFKVGDECWYFTTNGNEWYGAYSTDWLEIESTTTLSYMIDKYADENMYFKSKSEAIDAMMERLHELRGE